MTPKELEARGDKEKDKVKAKAWRRASVIAFATVKLNGGDVNNQIGFLGLRSLYQIFAARF